MQRSLEMSPGYMPNNTSLNLAATDKVEGGLLVLFLGLRFSIVSRLLENFLSIPLPAGRPLACRNRPKSKPNLSLSSPYYAEASVTSMW